jgi:hypothetical protein
VPLRTIVRQRHGAQLRAVHAALDQRFKQPNADWMGAFRAAAEWRSWNRWVGKS